MSKRRLILAQETLSKPLSTPKTGENSWLWLLKLVTGVLIFGLIVIHLVVNHLVAATGLLTYNQVLSYYQVRIVPIMESFFIALVVTHSMLGLRSIVLDLNPSHAVMKIVDVLFLLIGASTFVYGIWLIQVIVSRGTGT